MHRAGSATVSGSEGQRSARIVALGHRDTTLEDIEACCRAAEHSARVRRLVSEGLASALCGPVDLVIVEDGTDRASEVLTDGACRTLRELAVAQFVVVVSHEPRDLRERLLLGAGADYYVAPFQSGRLAAYVACLMGRVLRHEPSRIVVDGLVVDRVRRCCELRGERLALTSTEFDILLHLAKHADRLVSSQELATIVLGSNDNESIRARIRQHVYVLRRKSPILTQMVRTIRGWGYLLQSR